MANATTTVTLLAFPNGRRVFEAGGISLRGEVVVSAGNYPAHGIPVSFGVDGAMPSDAQKGFSFGVAYGQAGYVYTLDPQYQTLRVWVQGAAAGDALAELTASSAVPAGVTGDTIWAAAEFNRS